MRTSAAILFTRNGLGDGPPDLQQELVHKYLSLTLQSGRLPMRILFYTEGVRLCCRGSLVIDLLRELEAKGCELILCETCLLYYGLIDQVEVGRVGGMSDILTSLP